MAPQMQIPAEGLERYHRQMILPGVGEDGQRRLAAGHAVIVGCGALGCGVADLLARAGVGTLTIIDRDLVEPTNLQRQTLFSQADADGGVPKAVAAAARLRAVNPQIRLREVVADLHAGNAEGLLGLRGDQTPVNSGPGDTATDEHEIVTEPPPPAGVVVDGTDNFATRYLLNDVCVKHGIALVYGGVLGTRGMQGTFRPGGGRGAGPRRGEACLRCVFEEPPAAGSEGTCDTAGVLGPAAAIVAGTQASDAIKILLGQPQLVSPTLLEFDLWANTRRRLALSGARRDDCPCCGLERYEFLASSMAEPASLCGAKAVQVRPTGGHGGPGGHGPRVLDLAALHARLSRLGTFERTAYLIRGTLGAAAGPAAGIRLTVFPDGRAIVQGTQETAIARRIYDRFIGG